MQNYGIFLHFPWSKSTYSSSSGIWMLEYPEDNADLWLIRISTKFNCSSNCGVRVLYILTFHYKSPQLTCQHVKFPYKHDKQVEQLYWFKLNQNLNLAIALLNNYGLNLTAWLNCTEKLWRTSSNTDTCKSFMAQCIYSDKLFLIKMIAVFNPIPTKMPICLKYDPSQFLNIHIP